MIYSNLTSPLARRHGIVRAVEMMIEAGFTGIDVSMFEMDSFPFVDDYKEKCATIKAMADKAGVKFVQAHAAFSSYEKTMSTLIHTYPRAFEVCELLGIPAIVVHPMTVGSYNSFKEESNRINKEFYNSLKPLARKHNVKIAVENMWTTHPVTHRIVDAALADPNELRQFVIDLGDPEVFTVCLDLGHVALCHREPEDAIRIIGDMLGCLHVHDVDYVSDLHTIPGVGRINWDNVCRALADVNYSGIFNLEVDCLNGFLPEHEEFCTKFICDVAHVLADKVEYYKSLK